MTRDKPEAERQFATIPADTKTKTGVRTRFSAKASTAYYDR